MIGALWTGISGLAAHQTALDNESNNIANVNTVGYKAGESLCRSSLSRKNW